MVPAAVVISCWSSTQNTHQNWISSCWPIASFVSANTDNDASNDTDIMLIIYKGHTSKSWKRLSINSAGNYAMTPMLIKTPWWQWCRYSSTGNVMLSIYIAKWRKQLLTDNLFCFSKCLQLHMTPMAVTDYDTDAVVPALVPPRWLLYGSHIKTGHMVIDWQHVSFSWCWQIHHDNDTMMPMMCY